MTLTAARVVLLLVLAGAGVWFLYLTRGTTFWEDEWRLLLFRQQTDVSAFLDPHNGHLSLVPVAFYKLMFATVGLGGYGGFRVTVTLLHLLVAGLLFVYASRRVAPPFALLATIVVLLLGPAWQNILWPFQIAWLVALAAGIGALLAIDRSDRAGDITAGALLMLALASAGLGIPLAVGIAVELLVGRQPRRRLWLVAVPLGFWLLWYFAYGESNVSSANLAEVPRFIGDAFAGALAGLTGLAGDAVHNPDHIPDLGRPLAVAVVAVGLYFVLRGRRPSARTAGLLATGLSFWLLTALSRADLGDPYSSRYLYVGGLVIVLVAVELARNVTPPPWSLPVLGIAVAGAVALNLGDFERAGRFLRDLGTAARARSGALDVTRPQVDRNFLFVDFASWQYPAGRYYDAVDRFGSFGYSAGELARLGGNAGAAADRLMVQALGVELASGAGSPTLATAPPVEKVTAGRTRLGRSCVAFVPSAKLGGAPGAMELALPPGGLRVEAARPKPATVRLRRFGDAFSVSLGSVREGAPAELTVPGDRSPARWHVQLEGSGPIRACGLR